MARYTLQWAIVDTPYCQKNPSNKTLVLLLRVDTLQVSQFNNDAEELFFDELNDASSMPHPDQTALSILYTTWQ